VTEPKRVEVTLLIDDEAAPETSREPATHGRRNTGSGYRGCFLILIGLLTVCAGFFTAWARWGFLLAVAFTCLAFIAILGSLVVLSLVRVWWRRRHE
jgi:hypothetical protein